MKHEVEKTIVMIQGEDGKFSMNHIIYNDGNHIHIDFATDEAVESFEREATNYWRKEKDKMMKYCRTNWRFQNGTN